MTTARASSSIGYALGTTDIGKTRFLKSSSSGFIDSSKMNNGERRNDSFNQSRLFVISMEERSRPICMIPCKDLYLVLKWIY
jgi:hypothetical protein